MTRPLRWLGERFTIRRRVLIQNVAMIVLIVAVIVLSARSTSVDRQRALVDNVAGRQPELVFRYASEVVLVSRGLTADPKATFDALRSTASALLDGGAVLAVQGNDNLVHIAAQSNADLRAKLSEEVQLIDQLGDLGDKILGEPANTAVWTSDVAALQAKSHVTANVAHDAVGALTAHAEAEVAANAQHQILLAACGILMTIGAGWAMLRHIVRRLRRLGETAQAASKGDLEVRYRSNRADEIGLLGDAFNEMIDGLAKLLERLENDARRDDFGRQLTEALEMVDEEPATLAVVRKAIGTVTSGRTDLLVVDGPDNELHVAAEHPVAGRAGCTIRSVHSCVAIRRGAPTAFGSSDVLNSCPRLVDRPQGACSAFCVPVTFMGQALGVLHTTGAVGEPPNSDEQHRLIALASAVGARLGTVRAFSESRHQATTDMLTGLVNRRFVEHHLGRLSAVKTPFTLAMADLDHFKMLNDTYGHDAGDRALVQFASELRNTCRADDVIGRWGGEEFVVVFVGATLDEARGILDRVRTNLARELASTGSPKFTSSFGLVHSHDYRNLDELVRAADVALYQAKDRGRDQVVVGYPDSTVRSPERRLVEAVAGNFEGVPGNVEGVPGE